MIAALSGWLVASLAAALALVAWRLLAIRTEAVARASHELRGPITAARLGLEFGVRSGQVAPDRLRAIDLELDRAALALDDLGGAGVIHRAHRGCGLATVGEVELRELVASSVEAWRATADSRGVALRLRWSAGAGAQVGGAGSRSPWRSPRRTGAVSRRRHATAAPGWCSSCRWREGRGGGLLRQSESTLGRGGGLRSAASSGRARWL